MKRAIAYIDSRNVICFLEALGVNGHNFNYRALVEQIVTSGGKHPKDLAIKLYGARFPMSVDKSKHNRDDAFYKFVQEQLNIKVMLGQFKTNNGVPVEKGVDVRIATDLIFDFVYGNCDQAYIFSADTDLLPAIKETKVHMSAKEVFVCLDHSHKHLCGEFKAVNAMPIVLSESLVKSFEMPNAVKPTGDAVKGLLDHFASGGASDFRHKKKKTKETAKT